MEEKKKIKISLGMAILITIIILLVIALGIVYYFGFVKNNTKKLEADNMELNKQIDSLELEREKLNNKISELEKEENSIEETLNNNDTIKKNASKTFSNDEIKKAIQEYLDLRGTYIGGPGEMLDKLGFEDYRENEKIGDYTKTNIKYIEYKDGMLNYMTEECLKKDFKECFKEINGYIYFVDGGATGDNRAVESIKLKDNSSNFKYIANTYWPEHEYEISALEFHIAEYNGKCVISYCE